MHTPHTINEVGLRSLADQFQVKLNLKHEAIIRFVDNTYQKNESIVLNEERYYWFSYHYIAKQMQLLGIKSPRVISRYFNDLVKLGVISSYIDRKQFSKTYFALGRNWRRIVVSQKSDEGVRYKKASKYQAKVPELVTQKDTYSINTINTIRNKISKKGTAEQKFYAKGFELPQWIPEKTWNMYIAMRESKGYSFTSRLLYMIVNDLKRAVEKTRCAAEELLQRSIKKGWSGFYAAFKFVPFKKSPEPSREPQIYVPRASATKSEEEIEEGRLKLQKLKEQLMGGFNQRAAECMNL